MSHDEIVSTTEPFKAGEHHTRLAGLVGSWAGPTYTWLDPSKPPEESATTGTVTSLLGGRFVRLAYAGTVAGKPHSGEMLLGYHQDTSEHELTWIDSFHTGTSSMRLVGKPSADGSVAVLGSYAAGDQRWGWRTTLRREASALVVESFNISPKGEEYPAITTRLAPA